METPYDNVFKLLSELNPPRPFDLHNQYQNTNIASTIGLDMSGTSGPMNVEVSKPKTMEGATGKLCTKNPISPAMEIAAQLGLLRSTDETAESSDAGLSVPPSIVNSEWEMVNNDADEAKEEDTESENTNAEWEMLEHRDAKPCVVPASHLVEKKEKKEAQLKEIENKLQHAISNKKEERIQEIEEYVNKIKSDIEFLDRSLAEIKG